MFSPIEEDLKSIAQLSEYQVSKIAKEIGENEGWLPKYNQRVLTLKKEDEKLLWHISFRAEEKTDFKIGNHRFITIDDETREVKTFVGMR